MKNPKRNIMEEVTDDLEARRIAATILDVAIPADKNCLKEAYRRAVKKFHPDQNQNNPEANKKFMLIKCAYELLAHDQPCPQLLKEINSWSGVPQDEKYKLDNSWGHFLWWRDKFFG